MSRKHYQCEKCDGHGLKGLPHLVGSLSQWKDIMSCPQCKKEDDRLTPIYNAKKKWRICNDY